MLEVLGVSMLICLPAPTTIALHQLYWKRPFTFSLSLSLSFFKTDLGDLELVNQLSTGKVDLTFGRWVSSSVLWSTSFSAAHQEDIAGEIKGTDPLLLLILSLLSPFHPSILFSLQRFGHLRGKWSYFRWSDSVESKSWAIAPLNHGEQLSEYYSQLFFSVHCTV